MKLLQHSYLVHSLVNCAIKLCTGLSGEGHRIVTKTVILRIVSVEIMAMALLSH
jgi:hypothetical protein